MKLQLLPLAFVLTSLLLKLDVAMALASNSAVSKEIYGVPGSGWESPQWRWGYGIGTGHDCAKICRNKFSSRESRPKLIESLLKPESEVTTRSPPFEEVKLVLALKWQSAGGRGPYAEVLERMASCEYESEDEKSSVMCDQKLVRDMQVRYPLICEELRDLQQMESLDVGNPDLDLVKRQCSGLVLKAMQFEDFGI